MSNTMTEGRDRELPPDRHGEISRAPTPAAIELKTEILQASAHKEAGQGDAMRERSSIESRTDLRLAATNEAVRADPARSAATLAVEQDTARRWADLDAADFGRIRSDSRREAALEAIAGHMRVSPEYADELKKRSPVLAESAKAINDECEKAERKKVERETALPMIERNAAALAPRGIALVLSEAEQRKLARQDAKSLALVPEGGERHLGAAVVGENDRPMSGEEDRKTAEFVAMQLAQGERGAAERAAAKQRSDSISAAAQSRAPLIDAAALAAVANVRQRETARVVEQLAGSPDTATQQLRDAQQSLEVPARDGRVTAPDDPDIAAQRARALKRPVGEDELSQALLTRFIVSHEKRGLLDKGTTQFTFRNGDERGRVAFVDAGKALSTEREDKATIRAMIEVATAKNWKEVTLSGSDDFKRNAWIEASLSGLQVRGYEPREADKQILAELQQRNKPANVITAVDQEHKRDQPREPARTPAEPVAQRKHIDGDALTAHEKTVLDNSRAILDSKALGDRFTQAALRELEAKLRGERVYVGEIVDHGRAPYQFNQDNDDSYYVTLKTRAGEQVIWGKGLAEAMLERSAGEPIVLQNIGKRDVTVQERVRDAQGQVIGSRPKESQLNAWKSELLSRFSEKARTDFSSRSAARQPSLGVYDAKAPRAPVQPAAPARTPDQQRHAEQQRNSRER